MKLAYDPLTYAIILAIDKYPDLAMGIAFAAVVVILVYIATACFKKEMPSSIHLDLGDEEL